MRRGPAACEFVGGSRSIAVDTGSRLPEGRPAQGICIMKEANLLGHCERGRPSARSDFSDSFCLRRCGIRALYRAGWCRPDLGGSSRRPFGKDRRAPMKLLLRSLALVVFAGLVCTLDAAPGDNEKVPLDKLPKSVVDTVKAKFPKAVMKHAYKDTVDGKVVYEVGVDIDKTHLHAFVTAEGKLTEIHQEIDKKDVPAKVMKA